MKKTFILLFIFLLIFTTGCNNIKITNGKITTTKENILVSFSLKAKLMSVYWYKFNPITNSTLSDAKGVNYSPIRTTSNSNFPSKIKKSGTYGGTLIFPKKKINLKI
ncbi:MAG: hypothetical protein ACQEQF_10140 [Bacillota bacterium]